MSRTNETEGVPSPSIFIDTMFYSQSLATCGNRWLREIVGSTRLSSRHLAQTEEVWDFSAALEHNRDGRSVDYRERTRK
jgi:hypothetical protein